MNGLNFRRSAVGWSEDRKREWILNELRRNVRAAARETEHYGNLFRDIGFDPDYDFGFEDFAKLPVLTREIVTQQSERLISRGVPPDDRFKNATGGSTGVPTVIWQGPEERGWVESGLEFALERVGVPAGSRIAYFWGHHLDPKGRETFAEKLRAWALNVRFFDCFRLSPEIFHKYHLEFEKFSPDCILAYASALGLFAEYLKEQNIRPRNYPRVCFVTGAEKLHRAHREVIEEVFGESRPVYERYGGRDFGPSAIQTNPRSLDFEIDWTLVLMEPETDEDYSPILVTKLHADAMPLIRYRVGDIGRFPFGARSGNPSFYLCEVAGRELDGIWLPDGTLVHGTELPHMLKDFAIREFTLIQSEDYSVELQIVPKNGFDQHTEKEISSIIVSNIGNLPFRIRRVESIERTPANKWRPVITKVKR